ncbi:MAG TPA: hypothetical protein VGB97_04875 [Candidatus Paceibacterota bacterium]|jgi:nucleoside 2-deoxyribosyltransferase
MKSVTICSSNKFAKEALEFAAELEKLGVTVFVPEFYTYHHGPLEDISDHNREYLAMGLTYAHFQKIRKADAILLYNVDGYIGTSVTLELGFAVGLGKRVYAISDKEEDVCRGILVDGITATPAELARALA